MFQGTLLESSSGTRKRNRWPMATAFTLQMAVAIALVIVPLLSTGIIPLSARVPDITPIYTPVANTPPPPNSRGSSSGVSVPDNSTTVVAVNTRGSLRYGKPIPGSSDQPASVPTSFCAGNNCTGPKFEPGGGRVLPPPEEKTKERIKISRLEEGMLVRKVVPVYPHFVAATGVQGDVKLHAIIGKDGSIDSLSVISGPPLLTGPAIDAVRQWKYRPYLLNGDPVEVETYITVSFTRQR